MSSPPTANPAPGAADRLRAETRVWHERVEQAVDLRSRCADLPSYRSLLGRMLGLYEPLEAALGRFDWAQAGLDFAARRKARLLHDDLLSLGLGEARIAALPRCDELPRPASISEALGCLYVLEGATLGGQVIARQVRESLGLEAGEGVLFYTGYGERSGSQWRAFRAAADDHCGRDEARIAAALAGAVATFAAFESWLSGSEN